MNFQKIVGCGLLACVWGSCSVIVPQRTPPGVTVDLVPKGRYSRIKHRPMTPRYITIHATENRSRGGNAYAHAQMLKTGALKGRHNAIGYVGWHFTLDDHSIYQSLPTHERGEHADYDGPGNRSSIGIEMCENRGNDRARSLDKTARLTAWLLNEHGIPTSHVHQRWLAWEQFTPLWTPAPACICLSLENSVPWSCSSASPRPSCADWRAASLRLWAPVKRTSKCSISA